MKDISFSDEASKALAALKEGAFLTAGDSGKSNVMTIAWGSIGFMWGKPVFTVLVRPSRYTYRFMEEGSEFTVSVPVGGMKEALALCGSKSGRDMDKVKAAGLTLQAGKKVATREILSSLSDEGFLFADHGVAAQTGWHRGLKPAPILGRVYL